MSYIEESKAHAGEWEMNNKSAGKRERERERETERERLGTPRRADQRKVEARARLGMRLEPKGFSV